MENKKHNIDDDAVYPYTVRYAAPGYLEKKGYEKVAHLPFIFDSRPRYCRTANRFLIDLGTGTWSKKYRGGQPTLTPTDMSMKNYADGLANYLHFCELRGLEPLDMEYQALMQQYQGAMLNGTWSARGEPLSPKTVNQRVDIVVMFLTWASDKGLRDAIAIPTIKRTIKLGRAYSSGANSTKQVDSRIGKVREKKRRFGFPEERIIAEWLQRVRAYCGTFGLIAELIIETAIRRGEAAAWRVDTLPLNPNDWVINNPNKPVEHQSVLVTIRNGTKGHGYGRDHGDKIGPERSIHIPLSLAWKLHEYREKGRLLAVQKLIKGTKGINRAEALRNNTVHLFLKPEDGTRYSGQDIYDRWTSPTVNCPKGWHPHLARDFWACTMLWRHTQEEVALVERLTQSNADKSLVDAMLSKGSHLIQLVLKPQLGHVSADTTMIYLQWVADRLKLNLNLMAKYDESLPDNGEAV